MISEGTLAWYSLSLNRILWSHLSNALLKSTNSIDGCPRDCELFHLLYAFLPSVISFKIFTSHPTPALKPSYSSLNSFIFPYLLRLLILFRIIISIILKKIDVMLIGRNSSSAFPFSLSCSFLYMSTSRDVVCSYGML